MGGAVQDDLQELRRRAFYHSLIWAAVGVALLSYFHQG